MFVLTLVRPSSDQHLNKADFPQESFPNGYDSTTHKEKDHAPPNPLCSPTDNYAAFCTCLQLYGLCRTSRDKGKTNTGQKEVTLSDLVVYLGAFGKQVVLKPSDASDDIRVGPGVQKLFALDFNPASYVISVMDGVSELETSVFNVDVVKPKKIALLRDPSNMTPLFLAINQSLYNFEPPPDGTNISFSMGVNPDFPGWFVGTHIDFDNGTISSPYTGSAVVRSTALEVSAVPEPATLLLLSSGIAGVAIRLRRRRSMFR